MRAILAEMIPSFDTAICCPECFGRDLLSLTTDLIKWECVDCATLFTQKIGLDAEKQRALGLPAPYHPDRDAAKVEAKALIMDALIMEAWLFL